MRRDDALVIRSHHCRGSCSAPPPGSRVTVHVSCSDATTSPAVDTRATFSAEVPRSMAEDVACHAYTSKSMSR